MSTTETVSDAPSTETFSGPYTPLQIANTIIIRHGSTNRLSHMRLQKLVYFAYGWWMGKHGQPLTNDAPAVWRYGPAFEGLYGALKTYGHRAIRKPVGVWFRPAPRVPDADKDVIEFLDDVFDFYRNANEELLSSIAHEPGSPWKEEARANDFRVPSGHRIPDHRIQSYFARQLQGYQS